MCILYFGYESIWFIYMVITPLSVAYDKCKLEPKRGPVHMRAWG